VSKRVFISYAHESREHKAWVSKLASDLRSNGIDAILDQWDLLEGGSIASFIEESIRGADRIVAVCSSTYAQKADMGAGGVGYEKGILASALLRSIDTNRIVPIVRDNSDASLPDFLNGRLYLDFREENDYGGLMNSLLISLYEVSTKPPLGDVPSEQALRERMVGSERVASVGRATENVWDIASDLKEIINTIIQKIMINKVQVGQHMEFNPIFSIFEKNMDITKRYIF
jgi:hypothetical protein